MNLLQSAGFSRSNPYYIVPQGRITALCNAKDSDRLALLKEVAGTRVYEEHRGESLKIMEETERKREKIIELLSMINERLAELEEERTELEAFMEVDREKKACEYSLYSRELAETNKAIDDLSGEEQSVLQSVERGEKERACVEAQLNQLQSIESQLLEEKAQLEDALRDKQLGEVERDELLRHITHLELSVSAVDVHEQQKIERQLLALSAELGDKEQELNALNIDAIIAVKESVKEELNTAESQISSLKAKQSRWAQFKTVSERDKWVRQEVAGLASTLELCKRQLATLQEESKSAEAKALDLGQVYSDRKRIDEEFRRTQSDLLNALRAVKQKRDEIVEARRDGWRAEAKLEQTLKTVSEEMDRWERALAGTLDRATFAGLQGVPRLARDLGIADKVYGPVCELFDCDPVFRTAVETIAGHSLFNVVVEDEDTAIVLMDALMKEKAGRITFVPLTTCKPNEFNTNLNLDESKAIPLLSKLRFDAKFTSLMSGIYGQALVVPELTPGSHARDVDLVTLSGDRQSRRGAISGGFIDPKKSRLEAVCKLREWRGRNDECRAQLIAVRMKLNELEQSFTQLSTQSCLLERQLSAQHSAEELADIERQLVGAEEMMRLKGRTIRTVEQRIASMSERIASLEDEIGRPLVSKVEGGDLQLLESKIAELVRRYEAVSKECSSAMNLQNDVKAQLSRLKDKRTGLLDRLSDISKSSSENQSLDRCNILLKGTLDRLAALGKQADDHYEAVRRLEDAMEKARGLLLNNSLGSSKDSSVMERFLSKRSHLIQQRDDCQKKLREVGVVSEDLTHLMASFTHSRLVEALHKHNDLIRKRFPHVNRRAREQHAQYTRQAEELVIRKRDLDASADSISDFIRSLDTKKDEAILRTFNQVSEAFLVVLKELGANGYLEIVRDTETSDFVGISVNVSAFGMLSDSTENATENTENVGEGHGDVDKHNGLLLKQLSGGQKSLVALALILAIQRVDPAPFYLFDEVDAALDASHRASLARLLAKNGQAQYVITTFRPELVQIGDRHWGVSGGGPSGSKIEMITRETSLEFIQHA